MAITLESKKEDFLEKALKSFRKKDLNDARQSAEVFCKIILLKEFDNTKAMEQINQVNFLIWL